MKNTLLGLGTFVVSFLLTLLSVKVVLSIANLYQLDFINQFTFLQMVGISIIIALFKSNVDKAILGKEMDEVIKDSYITAYKRLILILLGWGLAFLYYYILR